MGAGRGRAGQRRAGQGRAGAELTVWQLPGTAIRLEALSASKVSLVASHFLKVAQKLNEADHAILVGVSRLHLCAQGLCSLLVLPEIKRGNVNTGGRYKGASVPRSNCVHFALFITPTR